MDGVACVANSALRQTELVFRKKTPPKRTNKQTKPQTFPMKQCRRLTQNLQTWISVVLVTSQDL